jgi:hypothetical protein
MEIVTKRSNKIYKRGLLKLTLGVLLFAIILSITFLYGVFMQRGGHLTDLATSLRSTGPDIKNSIMANLRMVPVAKLQSIRLDIKPSDLSKITNYVENSLQIGRVTSNQKIFFNAKLTHNGKEFDIKMRLKGDNLDHIDTEKKSFRIKIKNGEKIFGMSEFSVSHPKTRQFSNEWLYTEAIRSEGILTPRNGFLSIKINGKDQGIYIFEEHYTKEMIESQGNKDSVIFSASSIFRDWQMEELGNYSNYDIVPDTIETRSIEVLQSNDALRDNTKNLLREFGISQLLDFYGGRVEAHEVFDAEKMGKALALIELFAAHNTAHPDNFKFYLNPYTMLLEPVIREGNVQSPLGFSLSSTDIDVMPTMLKDDLISSFFISNLERYTDAKFLNKLKSSIGYDYSNIVNALSAEFVSVHEIWDDLNFRADFLRRLMDPPKLVQAVANSDNNFEELSVDVANVSSYAVELIGVSLTKNNQDIIYPINTKSKILGPYQSYFPHSGRNYRPTLFQNYTFELNEDQIKHMQSGLDLFIVSRLHGSSREVYRPLTILSNVFQSEPPKPPSLNEFLLKNKYFYITDNSNVIKSVPGIYSAKNSLIFPLGFDVELVAGTHIKFPKDSIMYLSGGSLMSIGSWNSPVILESITESWGGVVVMNAKQISLIDNTHIFNTNGVSINGWNLPGGVTFYKSDVNIIDSLISGSTAEDALNIVSAKFKIDNSLISATLSDAFDGDFVTGVIKDSDFYNITGDGIDLSGSTVNIKNVVINNVADKAISAGESSIATVDNSKIKNVGIAVASKDGSKVDIHSLDISNVKNVAFAAYRKKKEYGFPEIFAVNINLNNVETTALSQSGSSVIVNDVLYSEEAIDVEKMYRLKILGN